MVPLYLSFFFSRREEAVTARFADCPSFIGCSTAICFLFLSWRFSATQSFQTCQFSVAPSTATRAHNINWSVHRFPVIVTAPYKFNLYFLREFALFPMVRQIRWRLVDPYFRCSSVTLFTDFIRYCWNERLI